MTERVDAVVVGSGPNGLAAAITLASAGRSVIVLEAADRVGGGLRSDEVAPGILRDHCATVMPFAVGSPFLRQLPLDRHGLEWLVPEISFSHPLDGGRAGVAHRSLERTVDALGADGPAYQRLVASFTENWDALATELLQPVAHLPRSPALLARFGLEGFRSSDALVRRLGTDEAQGLFAGCAAHSVRPLDRPFTAAFALLFAASAHAHGWPAVRGGAHMLARAMTALLESYGGEVRTDTVVRHLGELPDARAFLFDVNPAQLASIAGDELPARFAGRLRRFRHGPGVYKVDYLLDGPVPWANADTALAATVHVGGTAAECASAEAEVAEGRHPDRPFVLVAQAGVVDATRTPDERQVLWAYTHVPAGSVVDMSDAIDDQLERFAPGFRDRVLERWTTTPAAFERGNPNLVGGDITGGALDLAQLIRRPRLLRPYETPSDRIFLCSSSTPPGGGVHGMSGHLAAKAALRTALR